MNKFNILLESLSLILELLTEMEAKCLFIALFFVIKLCFLVHGQGFKYIGSVNLGTYRN